MGTEVRNADVIVRAVQAKLQKIESRFEEALSDEVTEMVRRTRSGKDVGGTGFVAYTPAYNRFKGRFRGGYITRTGKPGKNAGQVKGEFSVPPQDVDLTLTGAMLKSLDIIGFIRRAPGIVATVGFRDPAEAAKARGNMKKRKFFGFAKEQIDRIRAKLQGNG